MPPLVDRTKVIAGLRAARRAGLCVAEYGLHSCARHTETAESIVKTGQKRIVLGVTGGIAAYKAAELVRLLVKDGTEVQVVMTEAACALHHAATMQALSGRPVLTDLWDGRVADNDGAHRAVARRRRDRRRARQRPTFWRRSRTVSPTICSRRCASRASVRCWSAPAMNRADVAEHGDPAQRRDSLRADGVVISRARRAATRRAAKSAWGACSRPQEIIRRSHFIPATEAARGQECSDHGGADIRSDRPVRGITNRSSGKMGYAIARAALEAGAQVTLVSGPVALRNAAGVGARRASRALCRCSKPLRSTRRQRTFSSQSPRSPTITPPKPSRAENQEAPMPT